MLKKYHSEYFHYILCGINNILCNNTFVVHFYVSYECDTYEIHHTNSPGAHRPDKHGWENGYGEHFQLDMNDTTIKGG